MTDGEVRLDFARPSRIGLSEAVLCSGKSTAQLAAVLDQAADRATPFLLTRLEAAAAAALPDRHQRQLDYDPVSRTAWFGRLPPVPAGPPAVAVVAAGTSDVPVGREAARTLRFHGAGCIEITDVGVAGLWRLMDRIDEIRALPVVIAVAGMDAALVSVLGGLVPGLIVAVPTSTGYGAARGGETALGAVLASCAPGIVTVNIDNGYGAACAALRFLRMARAFGGKLAAEGEDKRGEGSDACGTELRPRQAAAGT